MSKHYHFVQADVFTGQAFGGNQLAVFTDARGLTADEMQTLAQEMNYSESTFVLPPEIPNAVKRVRIFTPGKEMPMAGHPTVGTAFVLAQHGDIPLVGERTEATLQLGIGPVDVVIEQANGKPSFVWMKHREPEFGATFTDREAVAQSLGIAASEVSTEFPMQSISTGVRFMMVPLVSLAIAHRCAPNSSALLELCERLNIEGLYVFTKETMLPGMQIHARMFASPELGLIEDPATGSAAGPFGGYVARYGVLPRADKLRFVIEQGVEMKRPSQIKVKVESSGDKITGLAIGGQTVIVGEGDIFWE
ncbi:MAG: PhzF family phenazine biosynthesis protein [Chloroflexi bacterium]|nr:PhzF family phenazine biosynthesis protein [Chloroflexota bacterium]